MKKLFRILSLVVALICVFILFLCYKGVYNWLLYLLETIYDWFVGVGSKAWWFDPSYCYILAPTPPYKVIFEGKELVVDCYWSFYRLQVMIMNIHGGLFLVCCEVLLFLYLVWFRGRDLVFRPVDCILLFYFPIFMIFDLYIPITEYSWENFPSSTVESLHGCLLLGIYYLSAMLEPILTILLWKDKFFVVWLKFILILLVSFTSLDIYYLTYVHLAIDHVSTLNNTFGKDYITALILNNLGLDFLVAYCISDYEIMMRYCGFEKRMADASCKLSSIANKTKIPTSNNTKLKGVVLGVKGGSAAACSQFSENLESCIAKFRDLEAYKASKPDL